METKIADLPKISLSWRPVSKRLQILIMLSTWFMTTGAQWDILQTVGWGGMIANYSRTMPLLKAVQRTFDGEMCTVCKVVNEAKHQENSSTLPDGKLKGKVILVFQPVPLVILTMPDFDGWPRSDCEPLSAQRLAPPTPPPRVSVA